MIFTILFVLYSQIAVSITNCKTCGSSSGFGKELGTIYPTDPFFHTKNLNLSCTRSNGTSWNNQLSGYVSSEYIYATQNRRNQVILIVGHLTKDKNKIKIKGIKKWLPKNQLDNYHFVTQIDESIDKTFKSKIKGSNRWSEDCHITENNYFVPRVPYEDDKYSIEEKQKGLNRAIQTLKGFQMREFAINKRLTQEGYNVEVKFELADLITDLTIKMAQL